MAARRNTRSNKAVVEAVEVEAVQPEATEFGSWAEGIDQAHAPVEAIEEALAEGEAIQPVEGDTEQADAEAADKALEAPTKASKPKRVSKGYTGKRFAAWRSPAGYSGVGPAETWLVHDKAGAGEVIPGKKGSIVAGTHSKAWAEVYAQVEAANEAVTLGRTFGFFEIIHPEPEQADAEAPVEADSEQLEGSNS